MEPLLESEKELYLTILDDNDGWVSSSYDQKWKLIAATVAEECLESRVVNLLRVLAKEQCSLLNASEWLEMFLGGERTMLNIMLENYKLKQMNDDLEDQVDMFRAEQAGIAAEQHDLACTRCEGLEKSQFAVVDLSCVDDDQDGSNKEEESVDDNEVEVRVCPPVLNSRKRKWIRDNLKNRSVRRRLFADNKR